jgi:hypothetical protein
LNLTELDKALAWCTSLLGPVEVMSEHSKVHGGHESSTHLIHSRLGFCYLKLHHSQDLWNREVYAYEHWASAFGKYASRLYAVHDQEPLSLLINELPGRIVEGLPLSPSQGKAVWRAAGAALAALHAIEPGERFGSCRRDGSYSGESCPDARETVSRRFQSQIENAIQMRMRFTASSAKGARLWFIWQNYWISRTFGIYGSRITPMNSRAAPRSSMSRTAIAAPVSRLHRLTPSGSGEA